MWGIFQRYPYGFLPSDLRHVMIIPCGVIARGERTARAGEVVLDSFRRRRAMKLLIFSGFVLGLALAAGAVFLIGQSDEPVESEKAQPRGRWYNVTYPTSVTAIVDGVEQTFDVVVNPDVTQPHVVDLNVDYGMKGFPGITVDGAAAAVLDRAHPDDPTQNSLLGALIAGLQFSEFDPASAPWPYRPDIGPDPNPMSGITESN
jgi:hypothetical protein